MVKTLPITKARQELPTLVENAAKRLDEYVVTVKGVPAAVIMSVAEYESWKETMDILSDPGLMRAIREGEEDIKKGHYVTFEELKKELSLDHVPTKNRAKSPTRDKSAYPASSGRPA
jgi:prevent-host-death family protein